MRLLYVIDSLAGSGGAEQALAALVPPWVRDHRYEVHVCVLKAGGELEESVAAAGAHVHHATGSRYARLAALNRLVGQLSPDLIHTTLFESDVLGRCVARLHRTPVLSSLVSTGYGADHYGQRGLKRRRVLVAHALDAATGACAYFHAVSDVVAATMSRRMLIPRRRITVIPRGRASSVLGRADPERRARVRAALGLGSGHRLIVVAARHEPPKGVDLAVEALREIGDPRYVLLVAGREGTDTERLQELARGLQGVRFVGPRKDVPDLLSAADVVLVPSRREGISNVSIEAMCLGAPLVVTDVPAVRATVGGPENALLVPPDAASLADGVRDCLSDAAATAGRTGAARRFFEQRYELSSVAARMATLHAAVADRTR